MSSEPVRNFGGVLQKLFAIKHAHVIAIKRYYDDWTIKQFWEDFKRERLIKAQKLNLFEHKELGSDLAIARFVVNYCRGQVRNENHRWIEKEADLPKYFSKSFKVTGIYARNSLIRSEGVDNFVGLDNLEILDLRNNTRLDDFACDQLARQFRNSKTLTTINLSHNPAISVHGLDVLFKIPSLKKIVAIDTGASKYPMIDLFVLAAEDEKKCDVLVHSDGKKYNLPELEDLKLKTTDDVKVLEPPPQQIEAPRGQNQQILHNSQQ